MRDLEQVEAFWTRHAASFDDSPDHGLRDPAIRAAWLERLREWLPADPGIVADLGCGTGSLSLLAAELGGDVYGIDLAAAMIAIARQKAETAGLSIAFGVGDAASPDIAGESVDVILCRHLIWTLPDPSTALRRWFEVLRSGGRIIFIEGVWSSEDVAVDAGDSFPWRSGVSAQLLIAAVAPHTDIIEHVPLSASADLWGEVISSERYALIVTKPGA